jgi:hypothetical protein
LQGDAPASWADVDALWRLGQLVARGASRRVRDARSSSGGWRRRGTVDLAASPAASPQLLSAMQAGLAAKLGFRAGDRDVDVSSPGRARHRGTPRIAARRRAAQAAG